MLNNNIKCKIKILWDLNYNIKGLFGIAFVIAFHQILIFFFVKIECGLYF